MEPAGFFYMSTIATMGQIYFILHREEFSHEVRGRFFFGLGLPGVSRADEHQLRRLRDAQRFEESASSEGRFMHALLAEWAAPRAPPRFLRRLVRRASGIA